MKRNASVGKVWILPRCSTHCFVFHRDTSTNPQKVDFRPLEMVVACVRRLWPVICLRRNKDLWSWRSKYKSYEALRGCDLGVRDCLQVYCGK